MGDQSMHRGKGGAGGGREGTWTRRYCRLVAALPALALSPQVVAACTSPNVVNGPWTANQGALPECTNVVGWFGMPSETALFLNKSSGTPLVASGDNVYDDKGYGVVAIGILASTNVDNTSREVILHGKQTIQQTLGPGGTSKDNWTGMYAYNVGQNQLARITVSDDADVKIKYGAGQGATGVDVRGDDAHLVLDGSVDIDFSATDYTLTGVIVQDGAAMSGSGLISIGSTDSQVFHGEGLTVNQDGTVDFLGRLDISAGSYGLRTNSSAGDVVIDSSGGDWSTISSIGGYQGNLNYKAAVAFESSNQLTLKHVKINASGDDTIGLNMFAEGNLVLDDVEITVDSQRTANASGIDHSKGNLKASGLAINTTQAGVYGIWSDADTPLGNFTVRLCGTDGGVGMDCGSDGSVRTNTVTTQGEGAHGVVLENPNRTIELTSTTVTTHGEHAAGLQIHEGNFVSHAGVEFITNDAGADGIVWAPTGSASLTMDPTTKVVTKGSNAHGFVVDGPDLTVGGSGTFLPIDQFDVSSQGSAVVAARNGSTLTLQGVDLGDAAVGALSWGAKAEANSTILFGANAQAGGAPVWVVGTGTLDFNDDASSASGSLARVDQGGTLDLRGRSSGLSLGLLGDDGTSGGSVLLGGNDITLDGDGTSTFRGTIQGAGGLVMNGSGKQVLFGNSAYGYGGATTVESGTLAFAGGIDATGKTVGFTGGTLDISGNGGALNIDGIEGTGGTVALGSGGGAVSDLVFVGAGTYAYEGAIQGDSNLVMRGSGGVQTLSGANVFGYSGSTTIEAGTLGVTGTDTQAGGRAFDIQSGGTLDISAITATPVPGHVGFRVGSIENDGTVTLGDKDLVLDGTGTATFTGTIEGAQGGLVMAGSGTQTLSGSDAFAYGGATTIMSGTLALAGAIDATGKTVGFTGGTLDISGNGGALDIDGIEGTAGTVAMGGSGGPVSDLVFVGAGTYAYEGAIQGDGNLAMRGSGVQTLSGANVFGYSGSTTIEAGTLGVTGADTQAGGRSFDIQSEGTLDISAITATPVPGHVGFRVGSIEDGGTVTLGDKDLVLDGTGTATFTGTIEGAQGGLVMAGSGTQTLSGSDAFAYGGATTIMSGTLALAGGVDGTRTTVDFTGGTLDIHGNGGTFNIGGIQGTGGTVALGTRGNGISDLVFVGAGTYAYGGAIGGDGNLIKRGGGTQTLSGDGAFGYSGGTAVEAGTLAVAGDTDASGRVFNVQSNGVLDTSSVTATPLGGYTGLLAGSILGNGLVQLGTNSLVLDGTAPATFSGTIQGDDASSYVVKTGSGTLTLSGENAFEYAGTVIQKGVLKIRDISDPSQFAHEVTLDGGWLDLSDNAFVYDPDGTGADQWVALNVQDGANAASGGVIGGDDVLAYDVASGTRSEVAQLGGDGSDPSHQGVYLLKTGTGTLELTGTNHYVGDTRIQGGALRVSRDENLGNTSVHREVVLDGGSLEIAGSFESQRHIDLRQSGTVVVDEGFDTTWYGADGAAWTLTKEGEGRLAFHGASTLGGVQADGGVLDLGAATVDATKTAAPSGPAVILEHGATVDFLHGSVTSAGDAIVARGDSTLNLNDNTAITAGDGRALYSVTGGTGVVNADAQTLAGVLAADGQNSRLQLTLSDGSTYTGVPVLKGGGTAALTLADADSTWNLTGDAVLDSLVNAGQIVFGGALPSSGGIATAAVDGGYRTIHVTGDYVSNGGTLVLRTELNAGGALSDQKTDRLLVEGNISGQTLLDLKVSGSGANTNTSGNDQAVPSEGISMVQVGSSAAADTFKLKGDYVAIAGSPYQYRLFAYGTGGYPAPDPSQNLLTTGRAVVDYRLQSSCVDASGDIRPGTCSNPNPGPGPRPTPVPQVSSYLTVPLALQNYGAMVMDSLNRRLGDVRHDRFDQPGDTAEAFARAINSHNDYSTDLDWNRYGYDFDQNISAVQVGGNWVRALDGDQDVRLGAAATLGTMKVEPATIPEEHSRASVDAQSLALTATWQNRDGWYLDGLAMAEHYDGKIRTAQRGDAGNIDADGWSLSLEAGRTITLANGVRIEPQFQTLGQSLRFSDQVDADGIHVKTADLRAWTARLGVRVAMPVAATTSWMPYARVRLQHTWMNEPKVILSDQVFDIGKPGSAVQYGVGASGMVTRQLSLYGEIGGQRRHGDHGFSNFNVTIGGRYAF